MSHSAVARPAATAGGSGGAPRQAASRWWPVTWSSAAALRAVRATVVIPALFAITFKLIGDAQMTLFAVFGGFAQLVTVTFGGTRRDKALAHAALAVAGGILITIGTVASGSAWLAAIVTLPVAFVIYYAGSAGPNAAAGVTPCLFAYVLPIASPGSASMLPSRLEGWLLASAASALAVLLLSAQPAGNRLRTLAARLAAVLADQLETTIAGRPSPQDTEAAVAAKRALMDAWLGTPYRPTGLAAADQGLAGVVHVLEWGTSLVRDAADGHLDVPAVDAVDRELLVASARTLREVAAVLSGQQASMDLEPVYLARRASAEHLHEVAHDPEIAMRRADQGFHAQAIGIASTAAMAQAMIAVRRATPAEVAQVQRRWIAGLPAEAPGPAPGAFRAARVVAADASLRSVWFRNSARGAVALAAAVAVAKLTDVQHAFWVVLGTLSVLRTSAAATGSTAMRAVAGTIAGFAVGAVLLVGIGTGPTALWVAFPLAVLVAAYTPGTAPFVVGQAAFTVTIVVLFNLLVPAGWQVGLLRVEDVAIGCAVSLVVGFLFWPRGASGVVGDNLADAFRSGASYLRDATSWALGDRDELPSHADAAITAGARLDDAVRGYLTEQGSKRVSKADLWVLVIAAMRLRLTAHSMASLPYRADPHDDNGLHAALGHKVGNLIRFYNSVAAEVARPVRSAPAPAPVPPPSSRITPVTLSPCRAAPAFRSDALWVGHHLDHLEAHAADITGPAERLASVRRRPWWR